MKATFQNDDVQALYPGLSVAAQTLIETLKQAVVVPEGVVQHGPDGLFAFVVGADNTVSVKPIKVSHTGVGEAVVSDGLTKGQKVVLDGQYRLVSQLHRSSNRSDGRRELTMAIGISEPFIRYPIGTSLLMAGMILSASSLIQNCRCRRCPRWIFPTIQVTATLPGADPSTVASSIAQPLETQFAQIPGVTQNDIVEFAQLGLDHHPI